MMDTLHNSAPETPYTRIPGVFDQKRNCQVYYGHIIAAGVTLVLILIVTIMSAVTINDVKNTTKEMKVVIEEIRQILPMITESYKQAQAVKQIMCQDTNFTKFYPKYAMQVCYQ